MFAALHTGPILIGVVHLPALPGAPCYGGSMETVLERARFDARALLVGGCDALIVENFGDVPFYGDRVPAETVAGMALALDAVQAVAKELGPGPNLSQGEPAGAEAAKSEAAKLEAGGSEPSTPNGSAPVGVNVLRNDARSALGLCAATGAGFLRVNVHSGAAVTDQGLIEGRAAETLRERQRLSPGAWLLGDVHVKHATPLGAQSLGDAAEEICSRALVDGVIVSGSRTGAAPTLEEVRIVRARCKGVPLLIGSGLCEENARELMGTADGAIVGSWLKRDGFIHNEVDVERVRRLRRVLQ